MIDDDSDDELARDFAAAAAKQAAERQAQAAAGPPVKVNGTPAAIPAQATTAPQAAPAPVQATTFYCMTPAHWIKLHPVTELQAVQALSAGACGAYYRLKLLSSCRPGAEVSDDAITASICSGGMKPFRRHLVELQAAGLVSARSSGRWACEGHAQAMAETEQRIQSSSNAGRARHGKPRNKQDTRSAPAYSPAHAPVSAAAQETKTHIPLSPSGVNTFGKGRSHPVYKKPDPLSHDPDKSRTSVRFDLLGFLGKTCGDHYEPRRGPERGVWPTLLGPNPEQPGCKIDPELVEAVRQELGLAD